MTCNEDRNLIRFTFEGHYKTVELIRDIVTFIDELEEVVKSTFGISLCMEPRQPNHAGARRHTKGVKWTI